MKQGAFILALVAVALQAPAAVADDRDRWYLGASVDEVYDSNVMNSRGPDGVTQVSPRAGVIIDTPTLQFGAEYRLALRIYETGTADDSINHRAALFFKDAVDERLTLSANGVLLIADDPALLDRPGVAIPLGGFTDLTLTGGESWRASRTATIDASYMFRRTRFEDADPANDVFNGDEHRVDADLALRLSRRVTVRALGRWQKFVTYDAPPEMDIGDAWGGGGQIDWQVDRRLHFMANAGPIWFTGAGTTWFGRVELFEVGRRWRVGIIALRDLYGGTGADQAIWGDSLNLDGTYHFAKHLWIRGRAGGYVSGPAPDLGSNVSGLIGHAELGWLWSRDLRIDVYGEHRWQSADGGTAFGDVQRTVVGMRLTVVTGADLNSIGEVP